MLKVDLHLHTIYSGHAFASFYETLNYASDNKMEIIAITDHGPTVDGACEAIAFNLGKRAPKTFKGMKVLWGCESNIINQDGTIDLPNETIKHLDILLVGIHPTTVSKDWGIKKNTEAAINCFKKYPISIFTHPTTFIYPIDLDKICEAAFENNVLLELNLSSLIRLKNNSERECINRMKRMIKLVKQNNKKVIINSDAHFLHEIGDDAILSEYWAELGLTDEMIMNNYPKELLTFIQQKKESWVQSK